MAGGYQLKFSHNLILRFFPFCVNHLHPISLRNVLPGPSASPCSRLRRGSGRKEKRRKRQKHFRCSKRSPCIATAPPCFIPDSFCLHVLSAAVASAVGCIILSLILAAVFGLVLLSLPLAVLALVLAVVAGTAVLAVIVFRHLFKPPVSFWLQQ